MTSDEFGMTVLRALPYEPTEQQMLVIAAMARFIAAPIDSDDRVFILNGYAGTGKTSLTGAVVQALGAWGRQSVLLAPTGRAAKVFGAYAHRQAHTIHRQIYRLTSTGVETVANNLTGAVFIVDEASMIGETDGLNSLLDDLIFHVYSGIGCRLILLGDTAQLPPVGSHRSPAMDPDVLRAKGLKVSRAVMTATVRQSARSGILYNATLLRRYLAAEKLPALPTLRATGFKDVEVVESEELGDTMGADYNSDGMEETILVTRSNSRATAYNEAIRRMILQVEEELIIGERLMIVKNNYKWTKEVRGVDFIANGDMAVIDRVYGVEKRYGLRFADVSLLLPDRDVTVDCKIMLDPLTDNYPAMDPHKSVLLRDAVLAEASGGMELSYTAAMRILKDNPYYQALQVKYAYAVTCHKAQGGQWKNVYVDLAYIPEDYDTRELYRWLYTAVTRATHRLAFINPAIEVK